MQAFHYHKALNFRRACSRTFIDIYSQYRIKQWMATTFMHAHNDDGGFFSPLLILAIITKSSWWKRVCECKCICRCTHEQLHCKEWPIKMVIHAPADLFGNSLHHEAKNHHDYTKPQKLKVWIRQKVFWLLSIHVFICSISAIQFILTVNRHFC